MKLLRYLAFLIALGGMSGVVVPAQAAEGAKAAEVKEAAKDILFKGDARCTSCHDETDDPRVLHIGKTKHGTTADPRLATAGCTSCHGESEAHVTNSQKLKDRPKPDRTFSGLMVSVPSDNRVEHYFGQQGKRTDTPIDERNEACMSCHKNDPKRSHWDGSAHQARDVTCTNCHQIHAKKDLVRDKRSQPDVCFTCHKEQRAQVNRQSHHPIMEGKVSCSDCHNVHGSVGPKLVKRDSVVETCYTCHMEKRGPFVHNHQPVNDDCGNCHLPHGTVADNLLKARPPFACYQCHSGHGTPGIAGVAQGVATAVAGKSATSAKANTFIEQGRGCLNCHTEIHGSNNPNGGQNLLPASFFLR